MYYKIEVNTEETQTIIFKPLPYYEHVLVVILAVDALENILSDIRLN